MPERYEAICPNCVRLVVATQRGIILMHTSYAWVLRKQYDCPPNNPAPCPGVGHLGLKGNPETLDPPCYAPLRKKKPDAPVRERTPRHRRDGD